MKILKIKTEIIKYKEFSEFTNDFNINSYDLLITHKFLYEKFIKKMNLDCDYLCQEDYGIGEPSDEMLKKIFNNITGKNFKRIIAVGGGTVIDIAKLLITKTKIDIDILLEKDIKLVKNKELIVIPTTCGTGSEVTNLTILSIEKKKIKKGIVNDIFYPDYAILIPNLLEDLPDDIFFHSSIDALIHAFESFVSPRSNIYTELFSTSSIIKIINGYIDILEKGENHRNNILEDFLVASNYAGIAFSNTGVGAVHALSYPLGGRFHVPHGEANYVFFLPIFKLYNKINPEGKIKGLNNLLLKILKIRDINQVYNILENIFNDMSKSGPKKLGDYGLKEEDMNLIVDSILNEQQRLLSNSYVQLSKEDMFKIYKSLY